MIKKLVVASAAAALSLTLQAGSAIADDGAKRGGTLIWAVQNTPRHLNPAVQSGIATGEPGNQLFAAPLRYDEDWTPQPYLAKSWDVSADGLTVTLNLVKGATFHDGVPIKSSDVAFSIKTVQENHPFKTMYAPVEAVETPDEHMCCHSRIRFVCWDIFTHNHAHVHPSECIQQNSSSMLMRWTAR